MDTVLQYLFEKSEALKRAVGVARDKEIQTTGTTARFVAMQNTMLQHDITENHKGMNARLDNLERKNSDLNATIKAEGRRTAEELAKTSEHVIGRVLEPLKRLIERSHDERALDHKNWALDFVLEATSNYTLVPSPFTPPPPRENKRRCRIELTLLTTRQNTGR